MAENRVDLYASPLVTGAPTVGQPVGSQYQWQRAEIVRHLGASQYLVRLRYNNSIVNARIGWLDERIAKLTPEVEGRRQYLAVWLAVVRYYEQQVRNDLKLLVAVDSREFRAQRTLVEDAEKAFRIGIPYSYAEFQGKRHEVGDLGDELIWAAEDAAELIPNDEGIRDIPLAAIEAFHTALDNLTSASCWEFVPGDPCQDGGGGGDPIDESPFLSGFGSGWPGESPPTVEESGESGDGTGGGNRKAEAIAAARDLLAAFPTVEQCLERLRVSQKDLATAGAWYAAAKADLAVWVFDLTEAQGEKKLLTDRGVLADVEIPAWTTLYYPDMPSGTKVWVAWPCGDPSRGYPILWTGEQDGGEARYGLCPGQPQSPMAMGLAGSVLAYALSPAWQRHLVLGPWPATVLSVDEDAGKAIVRLVSTHAANNPDIIVRHPAQLDDLSLPTPAAAWRAGDIAALYRPKVWVDGRFEVLDQWAIAGWMEKPKTLRGESYLTQVQSDQCCIWHGGDPAQLGHLWWYVLATAMVPDEGWDLPHTFYTTFSGGFNAPECAATEPGVIATSWGFYELASALPESGGPVVRTLSLVALCVHTLVGADIGWVVSEYRQVVRPFDRAYQWLGLYVHKGYDLERDRGHIQGIREWIAAKKAEPNVSYVWKIGSPVFMTQGRLPARYPPD